MDSSRRCQNFGDANEVVGGRGQYKEPLHQVSASMTGLAQPADRLDPSERLLDLLSLDGADAIAGMAGGARIDRRACAPGRHGLDTRARASKLAAEST